jgi:four helix bundle protein
MKENILIDKSIDFGARIVKLYRYLSKEKHETVLSKQILRSGTSIGANVYEAQYAQSTKDFISKLEIALKECNETAYWLELLFETNTIVKEDFELFQKDYIELRRMIVSSITKLKKQI